MEDNKKNKPKQKIVYTTLYDKLIQIKNGDSLICLV